MAGWSCNAALDDIQGATTVELDRATVCLPIADRTVSHAFYTAIGFVAIDEPADDGLPEPLQFQISGGLRLMLIPRGGFGWVIGGREESPQATHEVPELDRPADPGGGRWLSPPSR